MSIVKPTAGSVQARKDYIFQLREKRDRIARLASLKGFPEWMDLKSLLEKLTKEEEARTRLLLLKVRSSHDDMGRPLLGESILRNIACSQAIKEAYEMILSLVENSSEQIEALDAKIKEQQSSVKKSKELLQ